MSFLRVKDKPGPRQGGVPIRPGFAVYPLRTSLFDGGRITPESFLNYLCLTSRKRPV